jgi:hypothetical protein
LINFAVAWRSTRQVKIQGCLPKKGNPRMQSQTLQPLAPQRNWNQPVRPSQSRSKSQHGWGSDYAQALDRWHGQYTPRANGSTQSTQMTGATAIAIDQAIDDARMGDDAAFSALVQQYYSAAMRMAQQILYTEEAAADAVQEALIKAHRAMHRFQDGNFRSWLLRIVTNTCYDMLRRPRNRTATRWCRWRASTRWRNAIRRIWHPAAKGCSRCSR